MIPQPEPALVSRRRRRIAALEQRRFFERRSAPVWMAIQTWTATGVGFLVTAQLRQMDSPSPPGRSQVLRRWAERSLSKFGLAQAS